MAINLGQSSVSKTLASLEEELGFLLFDRIGRRLKLSQQGQIFYRKIENALETIEGIEPIHDIVSMFTRKEVFKVHKSEMKKRVDFTECEVQTYISNSTGKVEIRATQDIDVDPWMVELNSSGEIRIGRRDSFYEHNY